MDPLLEILVPRNCPVCSRRLRRWERHLCLTCRRDLPLTYFWDWRNNPAEQRMWGRIYAEAVYALFYFDRENGYPRLLYRIKYRGGRSLAVHLGFLLGERLRNSRSPADWNLIVPVPLHPRKKRERGYNQAERIARGISEATGIPVETRLLKRIRYTRTQTRIETGHKWENIRDAFRADPDIPLPEQPHILLTDDVLTSGSTLEACAEALRTIPGLRISLAAAAFVE